MKRTKRTLSFQLLSIIAVTVLMTVQEAHAVLGESVESIASDLKSLSAMRGATTMTGGYTVQEITSDSTTIREYASPSGVVFGIAWNGLVHPELTMLLGSYADEYKKALSQTPRQPGRRHQQVTSNRVIVERWGHMRNLQGRAYAPDLVPQGVNVDEIK